MAQSAVYLFVVVAIAAIVESSGHDIRCPVNSKYSECPLRKSCRPSCDKPHGTLICTFECDVANSCVCNPGYLLNSLGKCVKPSQCPKGPSKCPANSTFSDCPLRQSCRPSCDKPTGTGACTRECDVANPCVCNPGYVLNGNKQCVKLSQCPKRYE